MEQPLSNTVSNTISKAVSKAVSDPLSNAVSDPLSNAVSDPLSDPLSNTIIDALSDPLSDPLSKAVSNTVSEEYIHSIEQSYCICGLSVCSLMSSLYGLQRNVQLSYVPLGLFITSVNYWRNPTRGIRRNIDIMAVGFGIVTHLYSSTKTNQQVMYGINLCICGGLYGLSWYLYKKGYSWASTISHGLIHIVANIANALLYNGLSELVL